MLDLREKNNGVYSLGHYLRQARVVDGSMWWLIREIDFDFEPKLLKTTPCGVGCQAELLEPISIQNNELGIEPQEEGLSQLDRIERLYIRRKNFLDNCLVSACKFGLLSAMETLIAAGAKVNGLLTNERGNRWIMPICVAAASGHHLAVRWLVNEGAIPNRGDGRESTALFWAVSKRHIKVVKELLKYDYVGSSVKYRKAMALAIRNANRPGGEEIVTLLKEYDILKTSSDSSDWDSSEDWSDASL